MFKVEPIATRPAGTAGGAAAYPANLPVGTVLAAEAVRDAISGQLQLLLAGRRWALKAGGAALEIREGQRVEVRVTRNQPDMELALVSQSNDVAAAMRRELPQQASPLRLLANVDWIVHSDAAASSPLPAVMKGALEQLWQRLPAAADLATPAGLEKACLDSGVRLESTLGSASPNELAAALQSDWKAQLYRLKDVLVHAGARRHASASDRSEAPLPTRQALLTALKAETASLAGSDSAAAMLGELAQQVQECIARVTCNQLASLEGKGPSPFPLSIEIPYRDPNGAGLLRLRFGRESEQQLQVASPSVWYVEFALDLGEQLGPLRGRVTLADGRVSVTLKPESAALAQAIDGRVDELQQGLVAAGVPVGKFVCVRSDPVDSSPTGSWLVNLRA